MTTSKIMEFLKELHCESYNRVQLGNDKVTITKIYEYLSKINCKEEDCKKLITNMAYLKKETLNLPLFLEIISKSLGFQEEYELDTIIDIVKDIHDMYVTCSNKVTLEEFIHDKEEDRIRKLFLNANNKYILKSFKLPFVFDYIADLKFASAMILETKEYQEFINYVDNYEKYQDTYSPLLLFHTYVKLRDKLKNETKLFWDILFGNEYIVSLYKQGISINQIYTSNVFKRDKKEEYTKSEQLDLFNYETAAPIDYKDIKTFQLSTIYNENKLPKFTCEKDFIMYLRNLAIAKESIILPKLKGNDNYLYNNF